VDPAYRRRGVAAALLGALDQAARGSVYLEVSTANPGARALYLKCGWEEIAVRKGYYDLGKNDAIVMKKRSW
jgi:[ribosomal protein S18]-alanine N-acetyltransferase